jgi:hypothetical protein
MSGNSPGVKPDADYLQFIYKDDSQSRAYDEFNNQITGFQENWNVTEAGHEYPPSEVNNFEKMHGVKSPVCMSCGEEKREKSIRGRKKGTQA